MPLQNRVVPTGEIVAVEARGTMMGNRGGAMHGPDKSLGRRRWVSRQWIACRLAFNGRHREVMTPKRYTELFFLDEATALAAGHRPCFECRRADALRFAELWGRLRGWSRRATAGEMDLALHAERLLPDGTKRTWVGSVGQLPAGTMVRQGSAIMAVAPGDRLAPWTATGYGPHGTPLAPHKKIEVLTPPSIVAVMRAGFVPLMHPTWEEHGDGR
jgi:hypothetical protein